MMHFDRKRLPVTFFRTWWVLLLRGLAAIAFGALIWRPGISLPSLVLFFCAFAVADGVLGVWAAVTGRAEDEDGWVLLLGGLVGIGVGLLTLSAEAITAPTLLFYIAIWAIATGVLQIVGAVRLRKEMQGEWMYILGGLGSVVFGGLLVARPEVGALALLWLIAGYAVAFGVLFVMLALKVRSLGRKMARGWP